MSAAVASGSKGQNKPTATATNWIRLAIETGIWLLIGLAGAAVALWVPGVTLWLARTLAYGWVAVGLFSVLSLILLVHKPLALLRGWRWWLSGGIVAAAAIIALSFVQGNQGALYTYGLSGKWGYAATGGSLIVAVIAWVLGAALTVLLVVPNAHRWYVSAARFVGTGSWLAAKGAGKGAVILVGWIGGGAAATGKTTAKIASTSTHIKLPNRVARPAHAKPRPQPVADTEDAPDSLAAKPAALLKYTSRGSGWQLPPLDTLAPMETHQIDQSAIAAMSENIKEALSEHGVYVDVEDVKPGPRVVRFGLVPGYMPQKLDKDGVSTGQRPSRVRVGDITKRQKDLALALKSPYIRIIETPEPGEGLVGLEVPNPSPGKVLMRSIVEGSEFGKIVNKGGLAFALGEDAGGQSLVLDLAAMPHLLIAGATGSGKSVCINSLVASLLMTRPPDELRMIMVDPKRVELTPFNGIPHLVLPVIVEPDEVYPALRGLINEMTRRYRMMEETGVRNIAGYNEKAPDPMPFLVLIVDELADLMMTGGLEVEQQLVRLAQLGRAAGIHMVLATQRPSVKVVTGLLKANVPARVAFAVVSQVDSRVILDGAGAEALMGKGDLLLLNNDFPKARRGQGTLLYDDEIDRIINFWREQIGPELPPIYLDEAEPNEKGDDRSGNGDTDDVYDGDILQQARDLALRNPRLNSAMLERRLKIRKSIADEIVEELRGEGLVITV